ncbi:hypothetical protein JTE90_000211 [Oedothorax gibbosus]|uniref:Uncharacterized protein n=1 Tax=Oedothorax gibbosus TaxID=931172 RepID=A0AAV6VA82_9ARAC|nr:hypothetical protein JTE90_000211 [Oedothorax gibbosus]
MKSRRYKLSKHDTNHISVDFSPKNASRPSTFISINESSSEESASEKFPTYDPERSSSLAKFVKPKDSDDYEIFSETRRCMRNQSMENFTQTEELEKNAAVQAEIVPNTFYQSPLRNLSDLTGWQNFNQGYFSNISKTLMFNRTQNHEIYHCLNSSQGQRDSELNTKNLRISLWLKECERFSAADNYHQNTIDDDTFEVSPLRSDSFEEWSFTRSIGNHRDARTKDFPNMLYKNAGELRCAQRKYQSFLRKNGHVEVDDESDGDVDHSWVEPMPKEKHYQTWKCKEYRKNGFCLRDYQDIMADKKEERYLPQVRYEEIWRGECANRNFSGCRIEDKKRKEIIEEDKHRKKLDHYRPQKIDEMFSYRSFEGNNRNPYISDYFNQDHFDGDDLNETRHKAISKDRYFSKKQKDINAEYLYQEKTQDKFRKSGGIIYREELLGKIQNETSTRGEVTGNIRECYLYPQNSEKEFVNNYSEEAFNTKHLKNRGEIASIGEKSYGDNLNDKLQQMYITRKPSPDTPNASRQNIVAERNCCYGNHEENVLMEPLERDSPCRTIDSESSSSSHENQNYRVQMYKKYGRGKCEYIRLNEIVSLQSSYAESFPKSEEDKSYESPEFKRELRHIGNNNHKSQGHSKDPKLHKNTSRRNFMEVNECESCRISSNCKQNPDLEMCENPVKNNDGLGVDVKEKCDSDQKLMLQNQMSPFKEDNETSSKPMPEKKTIVKYLKGQYHNLDADITKNSNKMVQELKEVLKKRGIAI